MNKTKLIMTYLVRNEDDIIEDGVRFHFSQGVDQFIIMDNLSTDSTREVIENLSKEIPIEYLFQGDDDYSQSEWVTAMARRALSKYMATWVINSDADEFWVSTNGTLKEAINTIDKTVGAVTVERHNNVVTKWNNVKPFNANSHPSTSTVFEVLSLNSEGKPLPPKILHRATSEVVVGQGNHNANGLNGGLIQKFDAIKILHFPYQSLKKYKSKILLGGAAYENNTNLPKDVGSTWRKEYEKISAGNINEIWEDITKDLNYTDVGLLDGSLFDDLSVFNFLNKECRNKAHYEANENKRNLLENTKLCMDSVKNRLLKNLSEHPEKVRKNTPLYRNIKFSLQGPQKQISIANDIMNNQNIEFFSKNLSFLRDSYSVFPKNEKFKEFIGSVFRSKNTHSCNRLHRDCLDKIVIMHVTCEKYIDRAVNSVNSFLPETEGMYHHIIVKGRSIDTTEEEETSMDFDYDGLFLTVPVSDSYEALNRKVFYTLMAINFTSEPKMIVKLDDDLHLSSFKEFDQILESFSKKGMQYSGRRVGASLHSDQWHGWHMGKCYSDDLESRGYTYPLPRSYAAGGYGYILGPKAIEAATNMYLGMKEFFQMKAVGLEDAYIGHAMYANNIEIDDVSNSKNMLAIPGLKPNSP